MDNRCFYDGLKWQKWHINAFAHTSTLLCVGPPNSTTHKVPDNHHHGDEAFSILPSQKYLSSKSKLHIRLRNPCLLPRGVLMPESYVDVPAKPPKFDFLYTNVSPNYINISIPFLIEKHSILLKLYAFYNNLLQIHPIYEIGLFRLWWKPSIPLPNFVKKRLKRQAHICIPSQCENPPICQTLKVY